MGESYDTLVDILESIEHFMHRVKIYQDIQPTPLMTEILVKIMVELLDVLALATKQISQGRLSKLRVLSGGRSFLTGFREGCKKSIGGERDRIRSSATGSTDPRRG